MFDFDTQLKNLPDQPGVYLMKNKDGQVIYVGKAKVLKNRVRQYFQPGASHIYKIQLMIKQIASFEYIVTESELDALILENNLIKQYSPRYNSLLKDDKNYPYIKVTHEEYPRVLMARQVSRDGAKYFGPYASGMLVKETIASIRKIFKIRTCKRKLPEDIGRQRPCLNYHINQCMAPCDGKVSKQEYRAVMEDVLTYLNGNHKELKEKLEEDMRAASRALLFEKAARLRDQIESIGFIAQRQRINMAGKQDTDIMAFAKDEKAACFQLFFMRGGKIIGKETFLLQNTLDESDAEVLASFIKQFYAVVDYIPKNILVPAEVSEAEVIVKWLSDQKGSKVDIVVPRRGENKKLVDMAISNAHIALARMTSQGTYYDANVMDLKQRLNLEHLPRRIECFDISNTGGSEIVGSMAVFVDGKPRKREYRKFKIQSTHGQNDYAAMQEMVRRRFTHMLEDRRQVEAGELEEEKAKFLQMPDVVFVDGGRGHVSGVQKELEELGVSVALFGLVKDDKHRTRAVVTADMREVQINLNSSLYRFLYQIQEEAHNFAIDYHHTRRKKAMVRSVLDDIPGVGDKTRAKLQKTFGNLDAIRGLSAEEISVQAKIPRKTAENIYTHFHT